MFVVIAVQIKIFGAQFLYISYIRCLLFVEKKMCEESNASLVDRRLLL